MQPEEKGKFDGIFESLAPVNGLLSGEKVKPVLINSKLPLDVLGRVSGESAKTGITYPSRSESCRALKFKITQ